MVLNLLRDRDCVYRTACMITVGGADRHQYYVSMLFGELRLSCVFHLMSLLWGGGCFEVFAIYFRLWKQWMACGVIIKGKCQKALSLMRWDINVSKVERVGELACLHSPGGLLAFTCSLSSSPPQSFPPCPATDVLSNVTDCCNLDSRQPLSKLPESLRGLVSLTHD